MTTPVALIAAVSEDGFIGRRGQIPWHIKGDWKFFKQQSMHKPNIMGRVTFETLPEPLPNRTNIVVTRKTDWHADGVTVAHDFDSAMAIARNTPGDEIMVIGGEEIYRAGLPLADRIYLTRVHMTVGDGDARFPDVDLTAWKKISSEPRKPGPGDTEVDYTIEIYERLR